MVGGLEDEQFWEDDGERISERGHLFLLQHLRQLRQGQKFQAKSKFDSTLEQESQAASE